MTYCVNKTPQVSAYIATQVNNSKLLLIDSGLFLHGNYRLSPIEPRHPYSFGLDAESTRPRNGGHIRLPACRDPASTSRKLFRPTSRFSMISSARSSGSGTVSMSIRLLSLSQKTSRLVLSRAFEFLVAVASNGPPGPRSHPRWPCADRFPGCSTRGDAEDRPDLRSGDRASDEPHTSTYGLFLPRFAHSGSMRTRLLLWSTTTNAPDDKSASFCLRAAMTEPSRRSGNISPALT